jgi:hypothetical protein
MKLWFAALLMALGGCGFNVGGRPDQGNFTVRASKPQVERLVQRLSKQFGAADAYDLNGGGNDPSRMFRLDGSTATVIVVPEADDRCNPNAPRHSTFHEGEYRIDLVYGSKSQADRRSATNALVQAVHDEGLMITEFREC